jgi:GDPmannose 4,6-dehydratase
MHKICSWEGNGLNEKGIDASTGKTLVQVDAAYHRPTEVDLLQGDSSKARRELKWAPKVSFDELVKEMVLADIELAKQGSRM